MIYIIDANFFLYKLTHYTVAKYKSPTMCSSSLSFASLPSGQVLQI